METPPVSVTFGHPLDDAGRREDDRAGPGLAGEVVISNKVFVGNLSYGVTREELIEAFSAAGKVVDAKLPTDRETGRPRGFAFVVFEDESAAEKSIQLMNGKDLKGRPLRVNDAEERPPRPPGGGGPPGGGFRPPGDRPFRPGGGGPPPEASEFPFGRNDRPKRLRRKEGPPRKEEGRREEKKRGGRRAIDDSGDYDLD